MHYTLFSYRQSNSCVHRLPALVKLLFVCFISMRIFANDTYFNGFSTRYTRLFFYTALTLIFFLGAQTPISHLKTLLFVPFLGLALTVFRTVSFFPHNESIHSFVLFSFIQLDFSAAKEGLLYTARFFVCMTASLVLFETMSSLQLQKGLHAVQTILQKVFPVLKKYNFLWIIGMTISFIPQVFSTWQKVHLAARARTGQKKQSLRQITASFSLQLFALLSCLLQTAEETRKAAMNRGLIQ